MGSLTTMQTLNSPIKELQHVETAPQCWRNPKKNLSRQLSMSETERDLAWEKKRHQRLMQEQNKEQLTIEDVNELKGCIELGFVFKEEKGGQSLANTFPALDLYFAVNRLASPSMSPRGKSSSIPEFSGVGSSSSKSLDEGSLAPVSTEDSWKFCSPGETPQEVKTKLRHWAQLVACSVVMQSA